MASIGSAVQAACAAAREEAFTRTGTLDGDLTVVLPRLDRPIEVALTAGPSEEAERYSMHAFGAVFAEVTVDPDLRTVRVPRIVAAYGAGRIVNPKLARSQALGAMVMGMGMALTERAVVDARSGRVVNGSLGDYLIPVNADVAALDVTFVEEHDPHVNPLGVKGVAELTLVGVPAAIANAVYHATGRRVRELPITVERLL
jgi:xanthine dehydrogenase YagR molybdenum-binding subunit